MRVLKKVEDLVQMKADYLAERREQLRAGKKAAQMDVKLVL